MPTLREGFVSWLRETYDKTDPADAFVSIGREEDLAKEQFRLEAIRAWLRPALQRQEP